MILRHTVLLVLFVSSIPTCGISYAQRHTPRETAHPDSLLKQAHELACVDTAKALTIVRRVLEDAESENDLLHEARACYEMGLIYEGLKIAQKSLSWFESSLRGFKSLQDTMGMAQSHFHLGLAIHRQPVPKSEKDYPAAEYNYAQAARLFRTLNSVRPMAHALFFLAASVQLQRRYTEAIHIYHEGAATAERAGDLTCKASCLQNIGAIYNIRGDLDSVLVCQRAVIELVKQTGDDERLATSYTNLASVLRHMGRKQEAEAALRTSYNLANHTGSPLRLAQVLGNIAEVEMDQGKYAQSIETYTRALSHLDSAFTWHPYTHDGIRAKFQRMIGANYHEMYKYSEALEHYRKASKIYERTGAQRSSGRGLVMRDLGYTYYQLDQLDLARQHLTNSLKIFREKNEETEVAASLLNLARVLKKEDSLYAAMELVREALAISNKTRSAVLAASAKRDLGGLLLVTGRHEKAERYLTDAVKEFRDMNLPAELSTALVWLARSRVAVGNTASIEALLRDAEATADSMGLIENLVVIADLRAELATAAGRYREAHEQLKKQLTLKDSIESAKQNARFQNLLVEFDAERRDHEIALLTSERERQRIEMVQRDEMMRRQHLEAERREQALALLSQQHEIQELELNLTTAELQKQKVAAEQQKQRLALADKDRELQAQTLERETLLRNVAIAGFILLAVISVLIMRALRLRRRESEARAAAAELQAQAARSESLRVRAESAEREEAAQRRFSRQLLHAQEEERQRIASDLHDSLAQKLVVIQNRATLALQRPLADEYAARQFERISATATDTVSEVRSISHALRPQLLSRFGLASALRNLIEEINTVTPVSWTVHVDDLSGYLSPDDEINLYRIVQEGVHNTVRHANARHALLEVRHEDIHIRLLLSDDGKGFDAGAVLNNGDGGLGLRSMKERANLLQATLHIDSAPGAGTRIRITVPLYGKSGGRDATLHTSSDYEEDSEHESVNAEANPPSASSEATA